MDIEGLKKKVTEVLASENLHLYDLTKRIEEDENILEVVIDESLDLETLSAIAPKISSAIDDIDTATAPYLLDVTCVGVERPLRNFEELATHVSDYIALTLKDGTELEGDLLAVEGSDLSLLTKNKNLKKKISVSYEDVLKARLAVKF